MENSNAPKDTSAAERFVDQFETTIEEGALTDEQKQSLSCAFPSAEDLGKGLPLLKQKAEDYKNQIGTCDRYIKMYQDSKKMWKARSEAFLGILQQVLVRLNIPGKSIKAEGVKLSTRTTSVIEVDEDWLISMHQALADTLQQQLPDFIKVSLSIDKTKLNNYLKTDNTLLVQNPDRIHTKDSASTTIK